MLCLRFYDWLCLDDPLAEDDWNFIDLIRLDAFCSHNVRGRFRPHVQIFLFDVRRTGCSLVLRALGIWAQSARLRLTLACFARSVVQLLLIMGGSILMRSLCSAVAHILDFYDHVWGVWLRFSQGGFYLFLHIVMSVQALY